MKKLKPVVAKYLGIAVILAILAGIIAVLILFGGGIMAMFGFRYTSIQSLILYFVVVGIVSFPCEMLAKGLPKALLSMERITVRYAKFMFVVLDMISSCLGLLLVDYFMITVSATDSSVLVISFLMAITSINDFNPPPEQDKKLE